MNIEKSPEIFSPELSVHLAGNIAVPPKPAARLEIESFTPEELPELTDYTMAGMSNTIGDYLAWQGTNLPVVSVAKKAGVEADLAIPAHSMLKQAGADAVAELSGKLAKWLGPDNPVKVNGGFINIELDKKLTAANILGDVDAMGDKYGFNNRGAGQTVVLDVSSPNIAKSMHLGHLRSTVIGESIARIMHANSYTVIRDNHLGDWGTQFGILAYAYQLWHDEIPELDEPETQIAGLQKLYVKINAAIVEEQENSEDGGSALQDEGRKWFTRLEAGDERALELWQWASDLSMKEFDKVYQFLGVDFEYIIGESAYSDMLSDVYEAYIGAGIATHDDKGRLHLIPGKKGTPPLTIRKSDGSSLYGTRDLASLSARMEWFDPTKILYVVGSEQKDYLKQVFDGFSRYAGDQTPELTHIGFGAIELPEGKMSTRRGNVVFLNDVIDEVYQKALEKVTQNAESRASGQTPEELAEIARQVTVGAIVYYDLKQSADRKITFSWDEALSFEGNTGPFLQYTHARMNALIGSHHPKSPNTEDVQRTVENLRLEGFEGEIIKLLAEYPNVVKTAADKYEPSVVSEYLYRLGHGFNTYYANTPLLKEQNEDIRDARMTLVRAIRQVLSNGMNLLNIPLPEKM